MAYNSPTNRCEITAEFHFTAPRTTWIRLQARVNFKSGAWLRSNRFHNTSTGKRMYTHKMDTTKGGCWGAKPQKPSHLWVTNCSTSGCTPATPGAGQKTAKPKKKKTSNCAAYQRCIDKCTSNYCMSQCSNKYPGC